MSFDIVTFGSATQDIFARSKDFRIIDYADFVSKRALAVEAGSKIYLDDLVVASGGGGTNAAATFALQGLKTAYVGLLGGDSAGREILKELDDLGIDCSFVGVTDKVGTPVSIILSAEGRERTILVYEGASHFITKDDIPWDSIKDSRWFYISSLAGESGKIFEPIISFAKENNINLAVNPGYQQLTQDLPILQRLLNKIDILIVNQQ